MTSTSDLGGITDMKKIRLYAVNFVLLMIFSACTGVKNGSKMAETSTPFDRAVQPTEGSAPNLSLPTIQNFSLSNGLEVKLVEHHELPLVDIRLVIKSGSFVDPPGKAGTASFTADMLDEGTITRDAFEIADAKDFVGARLGAGSGWDGSFVFLSTLKKHLDTATEIFADISLNPTFPSEDMEKIRERRLTGILQRKDQPITLAALAFAELVYGDSHPYGSPAGGTRESMKSITKSDLESYYSTYYKSNNATLIVVGDVTGSEILPILEKHFGSWESGMIPKEMSYEIPEINETAFYLVDKPDAAQSYLYFGHNSISRASEDYINSVVLNMILGGQFSARMNMNLREDKGYTYGARTGFSARKSGGSFSARASVKTAVTDSSIIEFLYELRRIRVEHVTVEELQHAKNSIVQRLPSGFETPSQIAGVLGSLILNDLPDDYYNTYGEKIQAVTMHDIMVTARKLIDPEHMTLVISGDIAQVKEGIESLNEGKVNIVGEKIMPE